MMIWIKDHKPFVITAIVSICVMAYLYGCESEVRSMYDNGRRINRQELQLELDQFMGRVQIAMLSLDKQDRLRAIILDNALILVQGQPLNPLGLLTGIGAIYGAVQGSRNVKETIKKVVNKRKVNNG